jgi:hypothetical protein
MVTFIADMPIIAYEGSTSSLTASGPIPLPPFVSFSTTKRQGTMVDASSRRTRSKGFLNRFRKKGSGGEDASVPVTTRRATGKVSFATAGPNDGDKTPKKSGSSPFREVAVVTPDAEDRQYSSRNTSPESLEPRREHAAPPATMNDFVLAVSKPDPRGVKANFKSKLAMTPPKPFQRVANRDPNDHVVPPPAREAAFSGPPRFDWIDIVSLDMCVSIQCDSQVA